MGHHFLYSKNHLPSFLIKRSGVQANETVSLYKIPAITPESISSIQSAVTPSRDSRILGVKHLYT
jgi:hypothetical protein